MLHRMATGRLPLFREAADAAESATRESVAAKEKGRPWSDLIDVTAPPHEQSKPKINLNGPDP